MIKQIIAMDDQKSSKTCCSVSRETERNTELPDNLAEIEQGADSAVANEQDSGMVYLDGGTFKMGTDSGVGFPEDGEGPVREVELNPFYISPTAVNNREFTRFVDDTGYRTDAERFGWSFVIYILLPEKLLRRDIPSPDDTPWWKGIQGTCWNKPEGPGSGISNRMDHPVVHVSWRDAVNYSRWAGLRLPTEAEWEYAARGGLEQKSYPWGDELTPGGEHRCNIWQGVFPDRNTGADGYLGTAPVTAFPPNAYGLYNVSGNVWEWCHDWFNPTYPMLQIRDNPLGPGGGNEKVIRGGSYLCHRSYCNRYRVAARSANTADSSTGNMGFRCAKSAD